MNNPTLILLLSLLILAALCLLISYVCFLLAFYAPRKAKGDPEEFQLPAGEIYEPYRDQMIAWIKEVRAMPCEQMEITSYDGLKLRGKYYEYAPGAPIELMLHGYRGTAERDLCGGVQRAFALGHSALIVDQRACGSSEGHVITFGIREHRDCLSWVNFMLDRFGSDVGIILTGISMGAATVTIAAEQPLPRNVLGILADCGYTSAKEMIIKTIREMRLPAHFLYPFVRLGAVLFGHFDPEETSPIEAAARCTVPAIFFHGEADAFVPCDMSRRNWEACPTRKALVTVPNAGHGLSYPADPDAYLDALREFYGVTATIQ